MGFRVLGSSLQQLHSGRRNIKCRRPSEARKERLTNLETLQHEDRYSSPVSVIGIWGGVGEGGVGVHIH